MKTLRTETDDEPTLVQLQPLHLTEERKTGQVWLERIEKAFLAVLVIGAAVFLGLIVATIIGLVTGLFPIGC